MLVGQENKAMYHYLLSLASTPPMTEIKGNMPQRRINPIPVTPQGIVHDN